MNHEAKVARERTTEKGVVYSCSNFRRSIKAHATVSKGAGKLEEIARGFDAWEVETTC